MAPPHTSAESGILIAQLATAALRSAALAAGAGVLLKILRMKATSTRLLTWTTVLYAALALPFLGWLLPPVPVHLPVWLATSAPAHSSTRTDILPADDPVSAGDESATPISPLTTFADHPLKAISSPVTGESAVVRRNGVSISWRSIATAIYLTVGLVLLTRFAMGFALTGRLVRASKELSDDRLTLTLRSRAAASACSFIPHVRESNAITVPVTVGPIKSTILLPPTWREWDDEKLDAILAHEMSHVARRDALTQCAALLHRAIFWFSPLAWWLNRHISELAEQASDEAALSGGADRNHYARTLLGFFETLHAAPQRVWWHGVSMANAGQAERRLEKILGWTGAVTMGLKKSAAIAIITLAVPVVCLTASVSPASGSFTANVSQEPMAPPEPAAPPAEGVIVAPIAGVPGHGPIVGVPAPPAPIGGVPAVPLMAAPPATPAQAVSSSTRHKHGFWYSYGFDDEQRFVIVTGKSESFTMSGSSEDARHVEKLRKQIPGDFIWFQRDEKSYIIRDQPMVDRARKLWAPQEELGKKQEELGRQQEALGKQQEELGARMEKVKVNVPDMTAEIDKLRAEVKALSSGGATQEQIGKLQSEIGQLQSKIGELQSHAGDEQGKLGEEMGALGEKQGKLGEQQGELGRQQAELAEKAAREMKQLLDEAIKNGTAKPEPEESSGASL